MMCMEDCVKCWFLPQDFSHHSGWMDGNFRHLFFPNIIIIHIHTLAAASHSQVIDVINGKKENERRRRRKKMGRKAKPKQEDTDFVVDKRQYLYGFVDFLFFFSVHSY